LVGFVSCRKLVARVFRFAVRDFWNEIPERDLPNINKRKKRQKMTNDYSSKRKQDNISKEQKRNYILKIRLNEEELKELDESRGGFSKAEAMRLATFTSLPPPIPELNAKAWTDLSKTAGNLNQLIKSVNILMKSDEQKLALDYIKETLEAVKKFRQQLVC